MTDIIWNPKWQLSPPAEIPFNADGSVAFGDPIGDLFLPTDYIAFMRVSDGAALRDKGSWFLAHFADGALVCEIEWLGSWSNLRLGTRSYYRDPDKTKHRLPPTYANIGYAEPGPDALDVVLNVQKGNPDYGKVNIWFPSRDPWMTGDNTRGLGHVADSFTAFMNGLTERQNL